MNLPQYPALALLVDGEWIAAGQRETLEVSRPATGELIGRVPVATAQDIERAADAAARAFPLWRATPAHERGRILQLVAQGLRRDAGRLAAIVTLEQGKTLAEAQAEIAGTADAFDWMAEEGRRAYGRVVPSRVPGLEQLVVHEPVGPVLALSPWNYPALLTGRKIATALAAGCTVVAKASEETPGVVVEMARLCVEAGVPRGALNLLFGVPAEISSRLIDSRHIRKISFTGSVPVGRHLSDLAGKAMKKITLELGGHSAVVIAADADVERAATLAVTAKFRNAGQTCHCPTRFLVHRSVHAAFTERLAALAGELRVGDGLSPDVRMGPVHNQRRVGAIRTLVQDAVDRGARVASGGSTLQQAENRGGEGSFWMPTVLADVPADARAMHEEPFGPLALVRPFDDLDEAVALANGTEYGLAAYAFTRSLATAQYLQSALEAGCVSINSFAMAPVEMPFGGLKQSGVGSEMGIEGLASHLHTKSIFRMAS